MSTPVVQPLREGSLKMRKRLLVGVVLFCVLIEMSIASPRSVDMCGSCGDAAQAAGEAAGEAVYQDCLANQGPDVTLVKCQVKRDRVKNQVIRDYILDNCLGPCGQLLPLRIWLKKRFPEIERGMRP